MQVVLQTYLNLLPLALFLVLDTYCVYVYTQYHYHIKISGTFDTHDTDSM